MIFFFLKSSVNHKYEGKWNNKNTRLSTCDPHARKAVFDSENPQEVGDEKEIVFTYDVEFQVSSFAVLTREEDASQSLPTSSGGLNFL